MKWDEMTARERDALVATKTMGWTSVAYDEDYGDMSGWTWDGSWYEVIPPYTTSISAAWEVVEKLTAKGLYTDIHTHPDFYVVTVMTSNVDILASITKPTAPEAISLAALRAVGVDV